MGFLLELEIKKSINVDINKISLCKNIFRGGG